MKQLSRAEVRKRTKYWSRLMGLNDLRITVEFASDKDSEVAACAFPQPQYRRGVVKFNLDAADFHRDPDWHIRHELSHLMAAAYTQMVQHIVGDDPKLARLMEDAEDDLVTRICDMPLYDVLT